jgi:plasmid replication initiation protein
MKHKTNGDQLAPALIPLPVAVDLIRFEKNLLQMGFFGAHDTRHTNLSTRRIEQWVNRDGQKIKVAAEFRGSQELGLPSTSDRDKYLAFMKIAMEQRAKFGRLENPIRFTGYQMLKELGLSFSGENYEDLNRWGQRMADTTITSEQVIYLAARKKYANKTVHVFRSFVRSGGSKLDDSGRVETYEVVLEDWILENLNQSYVVPEDFNAYRTLKRPTAKGVFGYLHLWFHASHGRPVEKDYAELCMLLNIPVYKHVSKIKETMGRSLDELTQIGYLSNWDIKPMVSKQGYKLILCAGEEVLHVLALSQKKQRLPEPAELDQAANPNQAVRALVERGVAPAKAKALASSYSQETILEQIEYAESLISNDRRKKIDNPAGFLVYVIENQVRVPTGFEGSRKAQSRRDRQAQDAAVEERYEAFCTREVETVLKQQFPNGLLVRKVKEIMRQRRREDETFERFPAQQQEALAEQFLRREVRESLGLPSLEEWVNRGVELQRGLFD